ncbi:MAG: sialidase family protein, partial [Bacteroidota bacterium]
MKSYALLAFFGLFFCQFAIAQPANTNVSNGVLFDGEPYLAINPSNNQNLIAAWIGVKFLNGAFTTVIKTKSSFNGGTTWSSGNNLPHFAPSYGSADPSIAFSTNGTAYICYIDHRESPDSGGVYVARSTNGGLNWDTPSLAIDMYDSPSQKPIDRPWMVVDNSTNSSNGTLYITSMPPSFVPLPNRPVYKVSTDGGFTWSTLANLDGAGFLTGSSISQPMATPATTKDGNFVAIYPSYVSSQNVLPAYYLAKSIDQG